MSCPKVVKLAKSLELKNVYTQDSGLRYKVFDGFSDCSSFVHMCFQKAYGIYVGVWTGEQVKNGKQLLARKTVTANSRITKEEMDKLVPGDCLYYGYEDGNAYHVEMYIGDGKQIGHGCGVGPVISDTLTYTHHKGFWQARRFYTEVTDPVPEKKTESKQEASDVSFEAKYKVKVSIPVRSYAGDEYSLLKSIPYLHGGELVEVCDKIKDNSKNDWFFVRINGCIYGFVDARNFTRIDQ